MAHRRIGQGCLGLSGEQAGRGSSLDELARVIAWGEIERRLGVIYGLARGDPAWPPLALFKALLLAVWYDLSDVELAEAPPSHQTHQSPHPSHPRTGLFSLRTEYEHIPFIAERSRGLIAAVMYESLCQGLERGYSAGC